MREVQPGRWRRDRAGHARERFSRCAQWGSAAAVRGKRGNDLYYFVERMRAQSVIASLGGRDRLRNAHIPPKLSAAQDEARKRIEKIKNDNWLLFQQAEEMTHVGTDG